MLKVAEVGDFKFSTKNRSTKRGRSKHTLGNSDLCSNLADCEADISVPEQVDRRGTIALRWWPPLNYSDRSKQNEFVRQLFRLPQL